MYSLVVDISKKMQKNILRILSTNSKNFNKQKSPVENASIPCRRGKEYNHGRQRDEGTCVGMGMGRAKEELNEV